MKRIDIYVPEENILEVTQVLHKHEVGGITLSDVKGRGKAPHEPIPEMVRAYMTGKKIIPDYTSRIEISSVIPDSKSKPIVDDLFQLNPKRGKIFVSDVSEAYDIESKANGEGAL